MASPGRLNCCLQPEWRVEGKEGGREGRWQREGREEMIGLFHGREGGGTNLGGRCTVPESED